MGRVHVNYSNFRMFVGSQKFSITIKLNVKFKTRKFGVHCKGIVCFQIHFPPRTM